MAKKCAYLAIRVFSPWVLHVKIRAIQLGIVMTKTHRLVVQKGFQEKIYKCTAEIAIVGGAMGAGKSYALILEVMKHIKDPHFRCGIFRKNRANILCPGGLWEEILSTNPNIAQYFADEFAANLNTANTDKLRRRMEALMPPGIRDVGEGILSIEECQEMKKQQAE